MAMDHGTTKHGIKEEEGNRNLLCAYFVVLSVSKRKKKQPIQKNVWSIKHN